MKRCRCIALICILVLFLGYPAAAQETHGPKMVMKEKVFDFQGVMEGEAIEHTFVVLNQGDRILEIEDVRPSCGCTLAQFDKAVPPGGKGKITLKVRTKGYQGIIHKSVRVYTNDPARKMVTLRLKAFIKVPIYLSSRDVYLYGREGQRLTKTVEVTSGLDRPLELHPVEFNLTGKLKYRIKEIEKGKRFRILLTGIPGSPGKYQGFLKLKTNYPEKTEITIWIRGRVYKR